MTMLISVNLSEKSFGNKPLYTNVNFDIQEGEKIGLIGRNGCGKSTLFHLISGTDKDYQGDIDFKKGVTIVMTRQDHHGLGDEIVASYIQNDLPDFVRLNNIIQTYPEHMGDNMKSLQTYSNALERFNDLGYFQINEELKQAFNDYQLDNDHLEKKLKLLSGGQKRMVELIKIQRARADLALIDEPTNHMDYIAKEAFIKWLKNTSDAVLVITHDRDILQIVDRIIEIRDKKSFNFKGNYEHYLKINRNQITSQVNEYDLTLRHIENLKADQIRFRRLKEKSRTPGTIKRFKSLEQRVTKELATLTSVEKPSFWIDRDGAEELNSKMTNAYQKYKAQNIRLDTNKSKESRTSHRLIEVTNLSLGYNEKPLFKDINFSLFEGERLRLHGRNGTGKTTLVKAIMSKSSKQNSDSQIFSGQIALETNLKIGLYEQEIAEKFLSLSLYEAIEQSLLEKNEPVSDQRIKRLMSDYLFEPNADSHTPINLLSGGQIARFQLIRMLLNNPTLLILDEPTNHLDLPSIEELENALTNYHGAIIYISHDSYFAKKVGGDTLLINP